MSTAVVYDRNGNVVEDDVVPDGGTVRVPIPFMDALSLATRRALDAVSPPVLHDGLGNPACHRAGFVFGPDELRRDAVAAYADLKRQLADAWRSPLPRSRSAPRPDEDDRNDDRNDDRSGRGTHDAAAAYAAYVARISNAWKQP